MANEYKEKAGEEPSFGSTSRTRSLKNLEKKEVVKMPSGFKMAKDITRSIVNTTKAALQGKEIVAKQELYSKRTSICRSCPWFSDKGERCQKCGCVVPLKAYFTQEKCPIDKW